MNSRHVARWGSFLALLAMTGCAQSSYYAGAKGTLYAGKDESFTLFEATGDYGALVPYGDSEDMKVLFALSSAVGYSPEDRGVSIKPVGFRVLYLIPANNNYMMLGLVAEPAGLTVRPRSTTDGTGSSSGGSSRVDQHISVGLTGGMFLPVGQRSEQEQGGVELRFTPHVLIQGIQDKGRPLFGLGVEMGWRKFCGERCFGEQ